MISTGDLVLDRHDERLDDGLRRQLRTARSLALHGAESLGCQICASIFLDHAHLLAADVSDKEQFVECLLLLGMTGLLARVLRATDGVELETSTPSSDAGPVLALSLSNGVELRLTLPGSSAGRVERERSAERHRIELLRAICKTVAVIPATKSLSDRSLQPAITCPA